MKNIYENNRKAWNQAIDYQKKSRDYNLIEMIESNQVLDEVEKEIFSKLNVKGKSICQLCCNNGRELISLKRLYNFDYCLGVDISDEAIKEAKELDNYFSTNINFIRSNVFEIANNFYSKFDYIYITVGTLNWIENITDFFKLINKLLNKNGKLIIYECHPFSKIFPCLNSKEYLEGRKDEIVEDYFYEGCDKYYNGIDYVGKKEYESYEVCEYDHTLSHIFNSIINNHFMIQEFHEYKKDISAVYEHIEKLDKIPLSYILICQKIKN